FLSLKNFPAFLIVFPGLLSIKRAVVRNDIETPLEVLCSSKLNFQFLEMNFQNERTVSFMLEIGISLEGVSDKPLNINRFWRSLIAVEPLSFPGSVRPAIAVKPSSFTARA